MSATSWPSEAKLSSGSHSSAAVRAAWSAAFRPDPVLTVSEWADRERMLSQRTASEPGQWRTNRTPYLREIMDCLSVLSPVQRVVFKKGAQIGATEAGNNWIGYVIDQAPGPMLAVQPTVDMAKRFSRQRVAPMIDDCAPLRAKVREARERDSGNTVLAKEFPGGLLVMTGANSAAGLRSMPARFIFLDEIDAYPGDVDGEGDPIALAEARGRTFQRRKVFMPSTPTIAGRSRVDREWSKSDQRKFFVPCPECGVFQTLEFKQLRWPKGDTRAARYHCEACEASLGDEHKTFMLANGEWRATAEGDGETVGFHLSSLYSPVGWLSWVEIAKRWEDAQGDPTLLKGFVNTILGEVWQERGDAPDWDAVYSRRLEYRSGDVPGFVVVLFAGVDVQKDRLEVGIWGFGRNRQRALIEHRVLVGPTNRPEVWAELAAMFDETWPHESGATLKVRDWGIDTGAFAPDVAAFLHSQRGRANVHAIDGVDKYIGAFIKLGAMDLMVNGKPLKRGLKTVRVGVSFCKQEIVAQLGLRPGENGELPHGFIALPQDVTQEQVKQLTSESLVTVTKNGRVKREWQIMEGRRNEVLDCANYARGLAAMRGWDRWKPKTFAEYESAQRIIGKPPEPTKRAAEPAENYEAPEREPLDLPAPPPRAAAAPAARRRFSQSPYLA